jgi:hypothetical protein
VPTNGKRRPPRPRIELLSPAPSPEEAAAVVAAIERFIADTAPPPPAGGSPRSRWQQAALEEGVGAKEAVVSPRGAPRGWGAR